MEDFKDKVSKKEEPAKSQLSRSGAIFAIVSTIIGGGIVGIPYGFQQFGLYLGIIILGALGVQQANAA